MNDDPYTPKKTTLGWNKVPECIYFYYIGPNPNGDDRYVREYYSQWTNFPIDTAELKDAVVQLTQNARKDLKYQSPPPSGRDWENMLWTRISYIAVLIDDKHFKFKPKGVKFDSDGYLPNHTFYDAGNWDLYIPDDPPLETRSAIFFINHMKDTDLGKLDKKRQDFRFKLHTDPPLKEFNPKEKRYPDSGGTNMGPPVPPP